MGSIWKGINSESAGSTTNYRCFVPAPNAAPHSSENLTPDTFDPNLPMEAETFFRSLGITEEDTRAATIRLGKRLEGKISNLRTMRLAAGLSQKKLAELLGTDQAYVSKLENAQKPKISLKRAKQLAQVLSVPLEVISNVTC